MNKTQLMGRLTRDPEVRYTQGEKPLCIARYTLAVDRRRGRSNNNENNTDFIPCVVFGRSAEFTEKYLKKGMKIAVSGRIQTGSYTNDEGKKVFTVEVVVEDQEFAESKKENGSQQYGNQYGNQYGGAPQGGYNGSQQYGNQYGGVPQNGQQYGNQYGGQQGGAPAPQGGYNGSQQYSNQYGGAPQNGQQYGNAPQNGQQYGNAPQNAQSYGTPAPQGGYNGGQQSGAIDGFMNIPGGIDNDLPFA